MRRPAVVTLVIGAVVTAFGLALVPLPGPGWLVATAGAVMLLAGVVLAVLAGSQPE